MASTDAAPTPRARPLSPHLSVWRPTMTYVMSIVHRITGGALYVGVLLLAWFLLATSMDAAAFGVASAFLNSFLGRLILFGFTWALFHHMLGGIRHFIWDAGYGMDKPEREGLAIATLAGGLALSIIIWAAGLTALGDTDGLAFWLLGPWMTVVVGSILAVGVLAAGAAAYWRVLQHAR